MQLEWPQPKLCQPSFRGIEIAFHDPGIFRSVPSIVKNFMTSSGCSMEGCLQKRKRYQPCWGQHNSGNILERGYALFSRGWGSPTVRKLEIQKLLRERFWAVCGSLPDLTPEMLDRTRAPPEFGTATAFSSFFIERNILGTITHKMITEPNFTIFKLFSVIPVLRLPNRIVSGIILGLSNKYEA